MVFIFDMDGVIVDNLSYHVQAWTEFGLRNNYARPQEDMAQYFGMTNELIFKKLTGNGASAADIRRMSSEKEAIYRGIYKSHIQPLAGLKAFLLKIKNAGCATAIATAAPIENVDFVLDNCGIRNFFDLVTDDSHVTRSKPDPQVFLITASRLGADPKECIVFEDSKSGITAAKAAGMRVIGIATSHTTEELSVLTGEVTPDFSESNPVISRVLSELSTSRIVN